MRNKILVRINKFWFIKFLAINIIMASLISKPFGMGKNRLPIKKFVECKNTANIKLMLLIPNEEDINKYAKLIMNQPDILIQIARI